MKLLLALFLVLFLCATAVYTQDATWIKNASHEVGLDSARGSRIVHIDVNNDDYPDLVWGTGNAGKNKFYIYLNVSNPDASSPNKRVYRDFTEESGINANRTPGKGARIIDVAVFADIDNDGDVDLVTSIYYHRWEYYNTPALDPGDRSEVMLNDGQGRFTLVENNGLYNLDLPQFMTKALTNTTGMSLFDYDLDGKLDLYMSQWFRDYQNDVKMKDILMKGNGDGTFKYVENSGINVVEPMYGMNVTDWNNDGWIDVITSGYCRSGGSLFMNNGNGTFTDVAPIVGYTGQFMGGDGGQNLCQWEAQPADFDNDGDIDLLQVEVHGGYDAGEGRTHVTINQGAEQNYKLKWDMPRIRRDAPANSHLGDQGGQWFDLDNDGFQDIAIGQMAYPQANTAGQERLYILRQSKDGYFDDISKAIGIFATEKEAHSLEPVDFDMDGDLDLMFSRQVRPAGGSPYMQVMLLRNDIGNKNNFISVKLNPPAGVNRNAVGARITVYTGKMSQIREVSAGGGHFAGQQHFIQLFGLGKYEHIDSIVVRWPSKNNNITVLRNLPVNVIVRVDSNSGWKLLPIPTDDRAVIATNKPGIMHGVVAVATSKEEQIQIINYGKRAMTINSIELQDANSVFSILNAPQLPITVPPNGSLPLSIKFTPNVRQEYRASIKVNSTADNQPIKIIPVNGFGFLPKPIIALSARSIGFDSAWVGFPRTATFTIKNTGELPLEISAVTLKNNSDGSFSIEGDQNATVNAGESRDYTLKFSAKSRKNYTDSIVIVSNAHNDTVNSVFTYANVTGPNPKISVNGSLFFPKTDVDKTSEKELSIGNTGDYTLNISAMDIKEYGDVFTMPELTLPLQIPAGGNKVVSVKFTPKEAGKTYSTQMTIASDAVDYPSQILTLRGVANTTSAVEWDEAIAETIPAQIMAFPQPASQNVSIKLTLGKKSKEIRVWLTDALGSQIIDLFSQVNAEAGDYTMTFDVSALASGQYRILADADGILAHLPLTVVK
ncbi:hypothetical protein MASR2M18_02760 [Ignavibacteria bacterium]|nr:VCBS repeat-containing protein [Bacteroidota bacterium]MCZ2133511.1 FG-GAP-like repeat-containing protein [Bacteroidota bacterium]